MVKPMLQYGSRGPAVALLQSGLNRVGPSALGALTSDGAFGARTRARVVEFQGGQALAPDGIVGAKTWAVLDALLEKIKSVLVPPTPLISPIRLGICAMAHREIGKVSDAPARVAGTGMVDTAKAGQRQVRFGWERLKQYFTEGMASPLDWNSPALGHFTTLAFETVRITALEGVKCVNFRPPLTYTGGGPAPGGTAQGLHWCGIFAAWILRQNGLHHARWGLQQLVTAGGNQPHYDASRHVPGEVVDTLIDWHKLQLLKAGDYPLKPGDVCVLHGGQNHHVIFLGYAGNQRFDYVAGNETFQEIRELKAVPLERIYRVYHVFPDY